MRTFFFRRALREKVLLVIFAALGLLMWAGRVSGRARALWGEYRSTQAELASQQVWLANRPTLEARAAAAKRILDPAKTISATGLVGELNALAEQAGLSPDVGSQRTERTGQFSFHVVQVNVRSAEVAALLKFYTALSARAPYIGLEQMTLAVDRANAGKLSANFRVVAIELAP